MRLAHASDTEALGARIAAAFLAIAEAEAGAEDAPAPQGHVHLSGRLGAGKTTLVRGMARALGIEGPVKSPTYTLLEPYAAGAVKLYHFDLYRIADGEELEYLGARDAFAERALCVVEWPERAGGWLPQADLHVHLVTAGTGREARIEAYGERGERVRRRIEAPHTT